MQNLLSNLNLDMFHSDQSLPQIPFWSVAFQEADPVIDFPVISTLDKRPISDIPQTSTWIPTTGTLLFQDGLVKTNMEKLTFYALSAPEKLDRIGAYLSEKLIRDVGRHRYG